MADFKINDDVLFTDRAIRLAGFTLGHAAWIVSELPEPLMPFGVLERSGFFGGKREINHFTAPTLEQAVTAGRNVITEKRSNFQSWTLAYDGYMRRDGSEDRTDAFVIEVGDSKIQAPIKVLQAYQPFSSGAFRLIGAPVFTLMDRPAIEPQLVAWLSKTLLRGVRSHGRAKMGWWSSWVG